MALSIQELKAQNDALQEQITALQNQSNGSSLSSIPIDPEVVAIKTQTQLSQNKPNPFSASTEIDYVVPDNTVGAYIGIYTLEGKELKKYQVSSGKGYITINGNEYAAGMYIYSIIINNMEIDSKRMILTHD